MQRLRRKAKEGKASEKVQVNYEKQARKAAESRSERRAKHKKKQKE